MAKVALSLYRNHEDLAIRLYGPIESAEPYQRMICDATEQGFRVFEGTYAVWVVDAPKAGPGTSYNLLALRTDVEVDPLKTLLPIPDAPSIPERAVRDHYPFFGDMSHGYLFLHAPDQLFVQATSGFTSNDEQVLEGEPLLVVGGTTEKLHLARFDGSRVSAPATSVSDLTAAVQLPTDPAFEPAESWDDLSRLITPDDDAALERFDAVYDAYHGCVGAWMAKNDPTWGKNYDIVYGSGETLTDKKFKQAAEACDQGKVAQAEEALVRTINAAASARAKKHLADVRARFGL